MPALVRLSPFQCRRGRRFPGCRIREFLGWNMQKLCLARVSSTDRTYHPDRILPSSLIRRRRSTGISTAFQSRDRSAHPFILRQAIPSPSGRTGKPQCLRFKLTVCRQTVHRPSDLKKRRSLGDNSCEVGITSFGRITPRSRKSIAAPVGWSATRTLARERGSGNPLPPLPND